MKELRRFRVMAVRGGLLLTLVLALIAYKFDGDVAYGLLLGGLAGTLGFWISAVQAEKLAKGADNSIKFPLILWGLLQTVVYGAVLVKAYTVDREGFMAFWGAAGGLLIIRIVVAAIGVTGADMRKDT